MKTNNWILEIPVVFEDGRFVPAFGTVWPKIAEGTRASIGVKASRFDNSNFVNALKEVRRVPIADDETQLVVSMSRKYGGEHAWEAIDFDGAVYQGAEPTGRRSWVFFRLSPGQQLYLELRASRAAKLSEVECELPSLNLHAKSVNELYTETSRVLEPGRRSHTGNVFARVAIVTGQRTLIPLEDVREGFAGQDEYHAWCRALGSDSGRIESMRGELRELLSTDTADVEHRTSARLRRIWERAAIPLDKAWSQALGAVVTDFCEGEDEGRFAIEVFTLLEHVDEPQARRKAINSAREACNVTDDRANAIVRWLELILRSLPDPPPEDQFKRKPRSQWPFA